MKVVNIRLVVEDSASETDLADTLAENSRSVYAAVPLADDGSGRLFADMERAKDYVVLSHNAKVLREMLEEGQ